MNFFENIYIISTLILVSAYIGIFFSIGFTIVVRTLPLGKIKDKKPISCDVCMGYWGYIAYCISIYRRLVMEH